MDELENKRNEEMVVDNTDYLATIEAIQKNSVNKEKYDALAEEHKKLLQAVANGQQIELENSQPDLQQREVYLKAYNENKFSNDLEFWDNFINLRKATIKEFGSDPCVTGSYGFTPDGDKISATYGEEETIADQMDLIEGMVKEADGNPFLFKTLMSSAMPKK